MAVSRRGLLGTVGLGALVAACGGDPAPTTSTTVPTTGGGTATVSPQSTGLTAADFSSSASCELAREGTEGPYYFDVGSVRSDIREDRPGTPLRLGLLVRDASCVPLPDAVVDVWHCDAGGVYSGFGSGDGERFLRGTQVTNAAGIVEFVTVYPGWYRGRTVHVHLKVHLDGGTALTSQLYFDDRVTAAVHATAPYSAQGERDTVNADDSIFDDTLVLTLRGDGAGHLGLMAVNVRAG